MSDARKTMSLLEADTTEKVCALERDNQTFGGYWILSDGNTVSIAKQKTGEPAEAMVSVPLKVFRKMVALMQKQQPIEKVEV